MPNLHRLYQAGQATIVHAVATPYRERSHFDGQDVLESGARQAGRASTPAGSTARSRRSSREGGPIRTSRPGFRGRSDHAARRARSGAGAVLGAAAAAAGQRRDDDASPRPLSPHRPDLGAGARGAHRARRHRARRRHGRASRARIGPAIQAGGIEQVRKYFAEAAGAAAKFLARADGPRVGALAFDGWDTHVNEGAVKGRLANLLGALDGAIAEIETNMGDAWRETVVVLVTEFGRTAHINGNDGTDHGTATVAAARRRRAQGRPRRRRLAGSQGRRSLRAPRSAGRRPICAPS